MQWFAGVRTPALRVSTAQVGEMKAAHLHSYSEEKAAGETSQAVYSKHPAAGCR